LSEGFHGQIAGDIERCIQERLKGFTEGLGATELLQGLRRRERPLHALQFGDPGNVGLGVLAELHAVEVAKLLEGAKATLAGSPKVGEEARLLVRPCRAYQLGASALSLLGPGIQGTNDPL